MCYGKELIWLQVLMVVNILMLFKVGLVDGNIEVGVLVLGQVVGIFDDLLLCKELIELIVFDVIIYL